MSRFSVEAVFKAIDKVSAPVSRMQNRVAKFTRSYRQGLERLNRRTDKLIGGMRRLGAVAGAGLAAAGAAIAGVIKTGMEFEQTLVNAAAKFPGVIRKGTKEFAKLESAARDVGATTEFKASQAAEGLNFLAMAGFNAEQAVAALPGIVDLATVSGLDLGRASDIATDSLGAFNLMTEDTVQLQKNLTRVSDVMARTSNMTNTSMEQLFETFQKAAPVATDLGIGIETVSALTGALANAGIKASDSGTALRNMLLRLSAPASEGRAALKALHVEVGELGNMRDPLAILEDLDKKMKGLGNLEKSAIFKALFGVRTVASASVLKAFGAEGLRKYREELLKSTGTTKTLADVMRDTTGNAWKTFLSAVESLEISLFSLRQKGIESLIKTFTEWVRSIDTFIKEHPERVNAIIDDIIEKAIFAAKAIGVFVVALVALKTALLIGNVALLLTNPVTLIALGVVAAAGAITFLIMNWDKLKEKFMNLSPAMKATLTIAFFPFIMAIKLVRTLISWVKKLAPKVSSVFEKVVAFFKYTSRSTPWVSSAIDAIGNFGGRMLFGEQKGSDKQEAGGDNVVPFRPQTVSPQERVARSIEESSESNKVDMTIRDESGRAEMTRNRPMRGVNVELIQSGAFG